MPSRADDSFLQYEPLFRIMSAIRCQCPLGLMTHFYDSVSYEKGSGKLLCQCPLGLMTHFYSKKTLRHVSTSVLVSMPSRADDSFLRRSTGRGSERVWRVNALSGWWLISTSVIMIVANGVQSVSMPSRADDSFLHTPAPPSIPVCLRVNALSGWWLISTEVKA